MDPRGSHEVIIEQIEEEKQLSQKQNLRYKYLQNEESLKKIQAGNKRSRRKSLNDAYCAPLMGKSDTYPDIRINEQGTSPHSFEKFIHSHRERREIGREARNQNSLLALNNNSEEDLKNFRLDHYVRDSKNLISRRKEERKSNSDTHSPFASFNDQNVSFNPIDDYGRTWTSATLATPCDNEFWDQQEQSSLKQPEINMNLEPLKKSDEDNKLKTSTSDIIRNVKLTYLSASSLSDDRWLCPICLDIFDDAVETPCCHNLFCEKCIVMASEIQNK